MSKYLIALLLVITNYPAYAQFTANVDSVYTFMKYNSIHHKRVNWEQEDSLFQRNIKSANSLEDTLQCFVQVLEALDDVHSNFTYNKRNYSFWKPTPDSALKQVGSLMALANGIINLQNVEMKANDFIYVRVLGDKVCDSQLIQKYAQTLYDSIILYNTKKLNGIINN